MRERSRSFSLGGRLDAEHRRYKNLPNQGRSSKISLCLYSLRVVTRIHERRHERKKSPAFSPHRAKEKNPTQKRDDEEEEDDDDDDDDALARRRRRLGRARERPASSSSQSREREEKKQSSPHQFSRDFSGIRVGRRRDERGDDGEKQWRGVDV